MTDTKRIEALRAAMLVACDAERLFQVGETLRAALRADDEAARRGEPHRTTGAHHGLLPKFTLCDERCSHLGPFLWLTSEGWDLIEDAGTARSMIYEHGCNLYAEDHTERPWGPLADAPAEPSPEAREAARGVLAEVVTERNRQEALVASGKFSMTCAHPDEDPYRAIAVLVEEVGEVSRATLEGDVAATRRELIEVAAVAVAMVEGIDARLAAPDVQAAIRDELGGG